MRLKRIELREALEETLETQDLSRPEKRKIRRALRNPRVLNRLHRRIHPRIQAEVPEGRWDKLLEWIKANWMEIAKLLFTIVIMLI